MVRYPIHLKKQLKTCLMLLQIYLVFGPIEALSFILQEGNAMTNGQYKIIVK